MSKRTFAYTISLTGIAGLGLVAAVAIAGDAPRIEKRDVTIRIAPPAFADIDADRDGAISKAEFDAFHAQPKPPMGEDNLPPPPPGGKRMRMLMGGGGLDANKDGKISLAEFSAPAKVHFDELDANKDGVLDQTEQPRGDKFERRLRR